MGVCWPTLTYAPKGSIISPTRRWKNFHFQISKMLMWVNECLSNSQKRRTSQNSRELIVKKWKWAMFLFLFAWNFSRRRCSFEDAWSCIVIVSRHLPESRLLGYSAIGGKRDKHPKWVSRPEIVIISTTAWLMMAAAACVPTMLNTTAKNLPKSPSELISNLSPSVLAGKGVGIFQARRYTSANEERSSRHPTAHDCGQWSYKRD